MKDKYPGAVKAILIGILLVCALFFGPLGWAMLFFGLFEVFAKES